MEANDFPSIEEVPSNDYQSTCVGTNNATENGEGMADRNFVTEHNNLLCSSAWSNLCPKPSLGQL
jgi:hypothetical protein